MIGNTTDGVLAAISGARRFCSADDLSATFMSDKCAAERAADAVNDLQFMTNVCHIGACACFGP